MITIRPEQLHAFRLDARKRLEDRVVQHLWALFPTRCRRLGDQRVREHAARKMTIATNHGVNTSESTIALCGWLFEYGEAFDRTPAGDEALEILRDPQYPSQIKAALIGECLDAVSGGRTLVMADESEGD